MAAVTVHDDWDEGAATITVCGEIDVVSVDVLTQCLDHVVARQPNQLVIDLAQVSFIDTSGLHAIMRAHRALSPDCPVIVRSPQHQARRILQISRLDTLLTIEEPAQPDGEAPPREAMPATGVQQQSGPADSH